MKKLTVIICILLLSSLLLPISANADVIYEPFDSFYEQHRSECTYVARNYTANGPNGDITLYASPEDSDIKKVYPNTTALYISYTYQAPDGILWGCCDNWNDNVTGWVPMEYLELIYDEQSFYEEHADRIVSIEVSLDDAELTGKTVHFWEYPGSADYIDVVMSADYRPSFQESYIDAYGNTWLRCGYFMGIKGKWVCQNDPTGDYETIYPEALQLITPIETIPAPTIAQSTGNVEEIKPADSNLKLIVAGAVTAVVAVTACLLVALKRKK